VWYNIVVAGFWKGTAGLGKFRSAEGRKILADAGKEAMRNDRIENKERTQ